MCSGSVVRMKKSFEPSIRPASSRKRGALRSTSSRGADALALGGQRDRLAVLVGAGEEEDVLAALAMWRASTSAAIVEYAWPR